MRIGNRGSKARLDDEDSSFYIWHIALKEEDNRIVLNTASFTKRSQVKMPIDLSTPPIMTIVEHFGGTNDSSAKLFVGARWPIWCYRCTESAEEAGDINNGMTKGVWLYDINWMVRLRGWWRDGNLKIWSHMHSVERWWYECRVSAMSHSKSLALLNLVT